MGIWFVVGRGDVMFSCCLVALGNVGFFIGGMCAVCRVGRWVLGREWAFSGILFCQYVKGFFPNCRYGCWRGLWAVGVGGFLLSVGVSGEGWGDGWCVLVVCVVFVVVLLCWCCPVSVWTEYG